MAQNCPISPSRRALCGNFEIRHTLQLNSPPPISLAEIDSSPLGTTSHSLFFFFVTFLLFFSFILSPLTAVSMGPICAHYKCPAFKRKAASLRLRCHGGEFFTSGYERARTCIILPPPLPASDPWWSTEPCEFVWSTVDVDGSRRDATSEACCDARLAFTARPSKNFEINTCFFPSQMNAKYIVSPHWKNSLEKLIIGFVFN